MPIRVSLERMKQWNGWLGEGDGGSIDDEDMRFGMWGEEEGNEGEPVVDCV